MVMMILWIFLTNMIENKHKGKNLMSLGTPIKSRQNHLQINYSNRNRSICEKIFNLNQLSRDLYQHKSKLKILPNPTDILNSFRPVLVLLLLIFSTKTIAINANGENLIWNSDKTIVTDQIYNSDTIILDGNLTILKNLTFEKIKLQINCRTNGSNYILVKNGGVFYLLNSTLESLTNSNYFFQVEAGGTLIINSSIINHCGWDDYTETNKTKHDQRGLYIQSNDVMITNSILSRNCVGIIVDGGSKPFIKNNDIEYNAESGIEIYSKSSPTINNNSIHNNLLHSRTQPFLTGGIYVDNSSPIITNNTISSNIDLIYGYNSNGICINNSGTPEIRNNTIDGHYAKDAFHGIGILSMMSFPLINGNLISNNSNGIYLIKGSAILNNNIIDHHCNLPEGGGYGLVDQSASNCINNTFSNNTYGICLSDTSATYFENNTIESSVIAGITGFTIYNPFNDIFLNCTFLNNGWDVNFNITPDYASGKIELINSIFNPNLTDIGNSQATITVKWFLRINVTYLHDGSPVGSAYITISDSDNKLEVITTTNVSGQTGSILLQEYSETRLIKSMKSPYSLSIQKNNLKNTTQVKLNRTQDIMINLDDIPPWFEVQYPKNNSYCNSSEIKFSGIGENGCVVKINKNMTIIASNGTWCLQTSIPDEGLNIVMVQTTDPSGNTVDATLRIFRDTVAPELILSTPENDFVTKETNIIISGSVSETDVMISINDKNFPCHHDGSFLIDWPLTEGYNSLNIRCFDRANNSIEMRITGIRDTIPPKLCIVEPMNNTITNNPKLRVRLQVEPDISLVINSQLFIPNSNEFQTELDLIEGRNIFTLHLIDKAGNTNNSTLSVILDTTNPQIILTSINDNAIVNNAMVWINGSTESGANIKIDGQTISLNGSVFSYLIRLRMEGRNEIILESTDLAGNGVKFSILIFLDTTPPFLQLNDGQSRSLTNNRSIIISGRTEVDAYLTINGKPSFVKKNGYFEAPVTLDSEGINIIHILVMDKARNINEISLIIIRDTILTYNISYPRTDININSDAITIIGLTELNATIIIGRSITTTATDGSFFLRIPLKDGLNNITIIIRDEAGNEETTNLIVNKSIDHNHNNVFPTIEIIPIVLGILITVILIKIKSFQKK